MKICISSQVNWALDKTLESKKGVEKLNKLVLAVLEFAAQASLSVKNWTAFKPVVSHLKAFKGVGEVLNIFQATKQLLKKKGVVEGLGFTISACNVVIFARATAISQFSVLGNIASGIGSYRVFAFVSNLTVSSVKKFSAGIICLISLGKLGVKFYENYNNENQKKLAEAVKTTFTRSCVLAVAVDLGNLALICFMGPGACLAMYAISVGTQAAGWVKFLDGKAQEELKKA